VGPCPNRPAPVNIESSDQMNFIFPNRGHRRRRRIKTTTQREDNALVCNMKQQKECGFIHHREGLHIFFYWNAFVSKGKKRLCEKRPPAATIQTFVSPPVIIDLAFVTRLPSLTLLIRFNDMMWYLYFLLVVFTVVSEHLMRGGGCEWWVAGCAERNGNDLGPVPFEPRRISDFK
jgi:hypothetical protein